jgi:hypothetical protein
MPYVIGKLTAAGSLVGEPGLPIDHLARPLPAYVPPVPEPVAIPGARLPRREHHTTSIGDAGDRAVAAQPAAVVCLVLSAGQPVAGCLHGPLRGVFPVPPDGRLVTLRAVLLVMARRFLVSLLVRPARLQAGLVQMASVVALPLVLRVFLAPHHRQESAKTLRSLRKLSAAFAAPRRGTDCLAAESAPTERGCCS